MNPQRYKIVGIFKRNGYDRLMVTEEDRKQFRAKLIAMQSEIRAVSTSAARDLKPVELDQSSVGRVSRIDTLQLQQMSQAAARRREQLLRKIEGALRRLESGRFGLCFLCGTAIDVRRLHTDPTITRCRECVDEHVENS